MARPREFDIETACEAAMNVFWDSGYKGTSLPELLEAVNLSRGSLYKAFGSKKAVFMEALSLYDKSVLQPGIDLLSGNEPPSGRDRIEMFFNEALLAVEGGDRRGCLLCNAAVGAASTDVEIGGVVRRMLDNLSDGFALALKDVAGLRLADADLRDARAQGITMSYIGFKVQIRSGADIDRLRHAANTMLDGL